MLFTDPWEHILHDQEAETKFSMKLVDSLHRAVNRPLLQDYHIHITKSVKPIPDEMKGICSNRNWYKPLNLLMVLFLIWFLLLLQLSL